MEVSCKTGRRGGEKGRRERRGRRGEGKGGERIKGEGGRVRGREKAKRRRGKGGKKRYTRISTKWYKQVQVNEDVRGGREKTHQDDC